MESIEDSGSKEIDIDGQVDDEQEDVTEHGDDEHGQTLLDLVGNEEEASPRTDHVGDEEQERSEQSKVDNLTFLDVQTQSLCSFRQHFPH